MIEQKIGPRVTKKDIAMVINILLKEITRLLAEGKRIEIRGFGVFKTKRRNAKIARNPRTGNEINIPARLVPVFKPSKILKQSVSKE
ncbi:integration host factor subunit beta [candidate division WOR-3 bacterium]|nr:integration host factor subunit beta [candidate division WOR-3 bacterium]